MSQMSGWVKDVFMIILSLTFMEMLMPEGNITKYVKFIYGIVILAVILSPLIDFVHK